jgi:hypothetical protein
MAFDPLILIFCRGLEHLSLKLRASAVAIGGVRANANARTGKSNLFIRIPYERLSNSLPQQDYLYLMINKRPLARLSLDEPGQRFY